MADDARITRTVETDLEAADLWSLVADGAAWAEWMVDDADIDVDTGAVGTVVDDGVARDVRIDRVEPSRSVAFTWWPQARPDQWSSVELVVVPVRTGSRLHVTETYAAASTTVRAMTATSTMTTPTVTVTAWDVRSMLLVARASFALA